MLEHGLLTAREIEVICAWKFPQRVEMVIRAAKAYQKARCDLRQAERVLELATDAHHSAHAHLKVPGGLDLPALADRQLDDAARRRSEAQRELGRCTDLLMDTCGAGADRVVAVLEQHDFRADREDLLVAFGDELARA